MTLNKRNISTSSDGTDIFTVAAPDSPFINLGALTTSGDLANAIRIDASGVSVVNKGALSTSGDGSSGVAVWYDNATVANYGTITTTGEVFDDGIVFGISGGVEFYSGDHQTGLNYGTISAIEGMGLNGSSSTLINYGTINARGAGFYIQGLDAPLTNVTAINYGTMHTASDFGGSFGIALIADASAAKNYGNIQVDGFFDFGIAMAGIGDHGENYGSILATGEQGRGVLLEGEQHSFLNKGTILSTGPGGVGVRFGGENLPGTDGGSFTNFGKVEGAGWAIRASVSDDHVVNGGTVVGEVDMGAGDDSFTAAKGGSLNGGLTLGEGDDLIFLQKGGGILTVTDFVAGAGTDDVIDLSAFGFASFSSVIGHALQSGSDVVLNLGKDQIVLQDVSLASLAPDDFALGNATLQGQAMLGHQDWFAVV
jgi:hypothetical protein